MALALTETLQESKDPDFQILTPGITVTPHKP